MLYYLYLNGKQGIEGTKITSSTVSQRWANSRGVSENFQVSSDLVNSYKCSTKCNLGIRFKGAGELLLNFSTHSILYYVLKGTLHPSACHPCAGTMFPRIVPNLAYVLLKGALNFHTHQIGGKGDLTVTRDKV